MTPLHLLSTRRKQALQAAKAARMARRVGFDAERFALFLNHRRKGISLFD